MIEPSPLKPLIPQWVSTSSIIFLSSSISFGFPHLYKYLQIISALSVNYYTFFSSSFYLLLSFEPLQLCELHDDDTSSFSSRSWSAGIMILKKLNKFTWFNYFLVSEWHRNSRYSIVPFLSSSILSISSLNYSALRLKFD